MGQARRRALARAEASAAGRPVERPRSCPACGKGDVVFFTNKDIPNLPVEHGACLACRAIWEAFPPLYHEDEVCAEPCDNCAFRPGSPEQRDSAEWKKLLATLDPRGAPDGWPFAGRFYCHKNVPLDLRSGELGFLFPKKTITFEGKKIETYDTARMRTCSGFLRMVWSIMGKHPAARPTKPKG